MGHLIASVLPLPVDVAFAEMVIAVPLVTVVTVALAGMPVPVIKQPARIVVVPEFALGETLAMFALAFVTLPVTDHCL